jgi:CheY-like chemotaxis protein
MGTKPADRPRSGRRPPPATRGRKAGDLRALERMLASLAHEIRTPLTGILALSELLAASELGERERRWVAALKSSAEHLTALTTLLVDGARAGVKGLVLRREVFDLRRVAEQMAEELSARAQAKGLGAQAVVTGELPQFVMGDPVRLRAALENLLDNAVKFTESGEVRLDVSCHPAARGTQLVFAVSDSGIGMRQAEIRRLFRPFTQASRTVAEKFGGAGLGLTLVRRLARAMGGDLTVTSRPGEGSTFQLTVILEPAAGPAGPEQHDRPGERTPTVRALRVLCAEDNPYGRVIMNTILSELGHRADFVGTGEAAVEAVRRDGYDVVLMDVVLAGMDGLEAVRRIRALPGVAGRTPVIGLSGHTATTDEKAARAAGMNGYLRKPVSPAALGEALAAAVR